MKWIRTGAITLAILGMAFPRLAGAAGPNGDQGRSLQLAPRDVKLADGGVLIGQVVDKQGLPVAGVRVVVGQSGKAIANAETDAQGQYRIAGLRGGVYSVATTKSVAIYRLWAPNTAPPAATASAFLVNGDQIIRGQQNGSIIALLANPLVLGGLTVTAIAIPLALSDDDNQVSGS